MSNHTKRWKRGVCGPPPPDRKTGALRLGELLPKLLLRLLHTCNTLSMTL